MGNCDCGAARGFTAEKSAQAGRKEKPDPLDEAADASTKAIAASPLLRLEAVAEAAEFEITTIHAKDTVRTLRSLIAEEVNLPDCPELLELHVQKKLLNPVQTLEDSGLEQVYACLILFATLLCCFTTAVSEANERWVVSAGWSCREARSK